MQVSKNMMDRIRLGLFLLLVCSIISCNRKEEKSSRKMALELNKKAVELVPFNKNDSLKKSIAYLDSATEIDSSCALCYANKLTFLLSLKQFDRARSTVHKILELRPGEYYYYTTAGMLYELSGDTNTAKTYFQQSLKLSNKVLDTVKIKSSDYYGISLLQTNIYLMLGDSVKSKQQLQELLKDMPAGGEFEFWKEIIQSHLNKTKRILLDEMVHGQNDSVTGGEN